MTTATVTFLDSGREPQCAPNPAYPEGKDIVEDSCGCYFALPYPAPRCGVLVVECDICHKRVGVTVAGRIDDPRSLQMACRLRRA